MQSEFDTTTWLLQTVLLTGLFLLLIPIVRTLLGFVFIAISHGLSMKNQSLRNLGLKLLPAFLRGLIGVGVGIGAFLPSPSFANPNQYFEFQSSSTNVHTIEVQPGDSLWCIAMAQLFAVNPNAKVGEVDSAWRQIWMLNKNQIGEDPGQLKAGMNIQIPSFDRPSNENS